MILKDFIKNSGTDLVYINDTRSGDYKGRLYTFDLSYPPDAHELKRFLDDYGHSEIIYGAIDKSTSTVIAQI